jgi:hypothetical protein
MSVSSTGIPLFAGIESVDDMFITTMDEMDKETQDEISIAHPVWKYLQDRDLIEYRDSIGNYVPVRLVDKPNSTVKSMTHYDDVDNTPQDALSEAKFPYGHIVGTQMYSREELVKNSGPEQLIDLVDTKSEQLSMSMVNHFGTVLIGTQDADGRNFMGLGRVVAEDQVCGGIDPTDAGFGYWQPQNPGSYALATEMRAGFRKLDRMCTYRRDSPDAYICGEDVYDSMQDWAEGKLQLRLEDLKSQRGWGDFNMFPVHNKTIIYDEGLPAKVGWLLNFKRYVKLRIHRGTNFQYEPWQLLASKVAKKRDMLVYASLYVKRRNANGIITYT